jgi:hypothetical protein
MYVLTCQFLSLQDKEFHFHNRLKAILPFVLLFLAVVGCTQSKKKDQKLEADTILTDSTSPRKDQREIELTSIYMEIPGLGQCLLEMNYLEQKVYVFSDSDLMTPLQVFGPIRGDIDFSTRFYTDSPQQIFNPEDLNFDGYPDLKIPTATGSGGVWYQVYLYEPKKKEFKESPVLTGLVSLKADSIHRKLSSHEVGSMGGANYVYRTFSWKGGHLSLERTEIQGINPDFDQEPSHWRRYILKVNREEGMDTTTVFDLKMEAEKEYWCLKKGSWDDLEGSPFPGEAAIRTDGRKGVCP